MRAVRLKQMEQLIAEKDFVSIAELCSTFEIHPNTARADIKELVDRGIVEKKYGGVSYIQNRLPEGYYETRTRLNETGKEAIGRGAASFLEEGDIIFVDAGTTTSHLFDNAPGLPENLTVITNNLEIINKVFRDTKYTIYVLPGKGDRQLNSFTGTETVDSLRTYNIRKAFIGTRGISPKGDLSSSSSLDTKMKSTVIDISDEVILMAGSDKVKSSAMINFASLDRIDCWICDEANEDVRALAEKHHVKLVESNK